MIYSIILYVETQITMKYFNKTRTIEQKITDREVLKQLKLQSELLNKILKALSKSKP